MSRIRIALVIVGMLALVGGGTALTEKSRDSPHRGTPKPGKTLAQVADGTSGKSASGLTAVLVVDAKQHLGSKAPADLEQRITDFVNGKLPARTGRFGFGRQQRFPGLAVVTSYLGISTPDLLTQLRAGKTLAQIANGTPGKSASGLIGALVADAKQRFGSKVPADLEPRITDLVNGVHANARPRPGPGGRPGFFRPNGSNI